MIYKTFFCYTDGGCSGNANPNLKERKMIMTVADQHGDLIEMDFEEGGSNNIAEILAIRNAIKYAIQYDHEVICIKSDSMNSLRWLDSALYSPYPKVGKNINDPERTLKLLAEIKELSKKIDLYIKWVPRDENLAGHIIEEHYGL